MSYTLRVRPTMIIASRNSKSRGTLNPWRKPPVRSTPKGVLSPNARRKAKSALRWLIACSPVKKVWEKKHKKMVEYKVNFVTLTFKENMQDDNRARKLLSKWLEMAKYRFSLERYVWFAEPQARGAIHFHLVTGTYMPHTEVRYTWNRLLLKDGLDQRNANSTDVHAVTNARNLEAYVVDYVIRDGKHEGRRPIQGKLWGCDHTLSQAGKLYEHLDDEEAAALRWELQSFALQNKLNHAPRFLDFTDVYCLPPDFYETCKGTALHKIYLQELELLKPKLKQKQLFPEPTA